MGETHLQDWRYETKFVLTAEDELRFLDWLSRTPDFYKPFPSRTVNSIYLDNLGFDCAVANLDGMGWRSKFRFRWYGEQTQPPSANFEIKIKRGRMGTKQSFTYDIAHLDLWNLSKPELHDLVREITNAEHIMTPVSDLHPVLYVGYERDYYQGMGGIRITVDRNLRFQSLTDKHRTSAQQVYKDMRPVLEFKYPSDLKDQVAEMMVDLPFSATRSSKYILGLAHAGLTIYY